MLVASSHQQQHHHHLVNKSSSLLVLLFALGLFQHVFVVNNKASERRQQQHHLDQLKAEKLAANNNRYFVIDFKMSNTRYWDEIDWYIKESADKLQEILLQEEKEKTMIKTLSSTSATSENNCNDKGDEGDNSNKEPIPSPSSSTGSTAAAPQSSEATSEMGNKMTFSLSTSAVTSPHLPTAGTNYQQSIKPVVLENNAKSNGGTEQQENTKVTASRKDSTRNNGHEKPFSFPEFSPAAGKKKQSRSSSSTPQSKFDELKSWCVSQKVARPIYTYQQYPGNPQLCVANVRLWNNWQYTGSAQTTKHQAAEMAATNAVSHLQASGVMIPNYGNIANPSLYPPFAGDRFSSPQQFYHPIQQQHHQQQPRGHYLPLHHQQPSNEQTTKRQNHAMHDQMRHRPFTGGVPPMPPHMYPYSPQLFHMPSSVPIRAAAIGYDIPVGPVRYPYVDPTYAAYQGGHQPMQPIVFIPPMAPYLPAPAAPPPQAQFVLTDTPIPPSQISTHNHHSSRSTRNEQPNSTEQSNQVTASPTPTSLPKPYNK